MFNGSRPLTNVEICELSYKLELKSNMYAGYQDPYGCGIGGFKKMEFEMVGMLNSVSYLRNYLIILICILYLQVLQEMQKMFVKM